jgi:sugar/nucleoside kinase (ribokinase family)
MKPDIDVLAVGNAIVDVLAPADDAFLLEQSLTKGSMRLVDAAESTRLYELMNPGQEVSGGSAANTAVGLASLGKRVTFVGRVAEDQLGEVFAHDIRAAGVSFESRPGGDGTPTARCLILVTGDGQRTMNTFLGASQLLDESDIDEEAIARAAIVYLEGYLWDPPQPRAALRKVIRLARAAGGKVAFTLSDSFCVDRHRADFRALIDERAIDILFANESEALSLFELGDTDEMLRRAADAAPVVVITRSEKGSIVLAGGERHVVPAEPIDRVVDTTGAGDLFAAGFLAGFADGRPLAECARLGGIAAAEIISHYGARPQLDLSELVSRKLQPAG